MAKPPKNLIPDDLDDILPTQFFGDPSQGTPSRVLHLMVLIQAIEEIFENCLRRNIRERHRYKKAKAWVDDTGKDLFSFETACDMFDRDPDMMRRKIEKRVEAICAGSVSVRKTKIRWRGGKSPQRKISKNKEKKRNRKKTR